MTICEYPECENNGEYRTNRGTCLCNKHYRMYKFFTKEIQFDLEEIELNKVNWY